MRFEIVGADGRHSGPKQDGLVRDVPAAAEKFRLPETIVDNPLDIALCESFHVRRILE